MAFYGLVLATITLSVNILGDYFSIWETRLVIGRMSQSGKVQAVAWLSLDLVATVTIYCATLTFGVFLAYLFSGRLTLFSSELSMILRTVFLEGGLFFAQPNEMIDPFVLFFPH